MNSMTNPRHLSKFDILITFVKNIRAFIALIVIALINFEKLDFLRNVWGVAAVIALIVLNLVLSYLPWKKFQYSLEQDRLIINRGVLNREEKTIYYNRIHSVNVQQPLLLRIFGLASLQIETPGGKPGVAEGELRVLKHSYAIELQQQLKQLRTKSIAMTKEASSQASTHAASSLEHETATVTNIDESQLASKQSSTEPVQRSENAEQEAAVQSSQQSLEPELEIVEPDYQYKISLGQLLKASLTSLNLNFAIIFLLGIYSFADDVLELVFPKLYDRMLNMFPSFYDSVVGDVSQQFSMLTVLVIVMITAVVIGFVWLLSIILYLIKFGDYQISRSQEQLSVSYGLLEKKSFVFDMNKVQAVIMDENPLRQWLGFAELRVQVITSNAMEQLVIHPFIRKKDITSIMEQLLPDRPLNLRKQLHAPPRTAYRNYAIVPVILVLIMCGAAAWLWKWSGLWLLLLVPVVLGWSWLCMRSAGVWLKEGELVLRKRSINRVTYFVRRKHIVTLSMKTSPMQRKRHLRTIHVQVLGSVFAYRVKSIADEHLLPIWQWYSRSGKKQ